MTRVPAQGEAVAGGPAAGVALRRSLERQFQACGLLRPFRRQRYDPGERLELSVTGVMPANPARALLAVERFVGGGFAGQVYQVRLLRLAPAGAPLAGLSPGEVYALKILRPPSALARWFRDAVYFLAYQGAFSAQVNPAAVRAGALWQKLVRRAAARRLGSEQAVCDTYATFYDENLHSFGEINEWISGRIWRFELDDRLFERWKFNGLPPADHNCPEYVCKKLFLRELVALLHEMGAAELARQYEWWTCKSQPNALKRISSDHCPRQGLTAIDFRAGLALLPFLPLSPADFALIVRGLLRGRVVQFDRPDLRRFESFIAARRRDFADLRPAIDELRAQESRQRAALPDVTNHRWRLLSDAGLRRCVRQGTITAWRSLGHLDAEHAARLRRRGELFGLLYLAWFIPLLGNVPLKLWGSRWRRQHLKRCLSSASYCWRALRGARIETLIVWHRQGRLSDARAAQLVERPLRYWLQRLLVGWLPASWHRLLTDRRYAWQRLRQSVSFTLRFLRDPPFREQWLLEQVRQGRQEGMLDEAEARLISNQVKDPFIQKYLRCLAVHLCTVPITQVVMVIVGGLVALYALVYQGANWAQAVAMGTAAAAVVQLSPVSPGSLARGLFVLGLMIKERDLRNYYIAAPVSFVHVFGYLAFPLQMVAHDPALARFMAGRWAKSMVRFVPVFGESGGLLEHAVFDLFFNLPLSIRRDLKRRPRVWLRRAVPALILAGLLVAAAWLHLAR